MTRMGDTALPEGLLQLGDTLPLPAAELVRALAAAELLESYLQRQLLQAVAASAPQAGGDPGRSGPDSADEQRLLSFARRQGLQDLEALDQWRQSRGLDLEQLEDLVTYRERLQQASEALWGPAVPSLFLKERSSLDRVVMSVVRIADADLATELFFQLQDGELSFADLVEHYAEGQDKANGGRIGPILVKQLNPLLARVVRRYEPGVLIPPLDVGGRVHLMRIESLEPARLDAPLRSQLLLQLRNAWLQQQQARLLQRLQEQVLAPTGSP